MNLKLQRVTSKRAKARCHLPAWRLLWRQTAIVLFFLLALSAPAQADEGTLTSEEQAELAKALWNTATQAWLHASEVLMRPCFRNEHVECQMNMKEALNSVPDTIRDARAVVTEKAARLVLAVRNNRFAYETAFSLIMLKSIVAEGADCTAWQNKAEGLFGSAGALMTLLNNAERELGGRTRTPEYRELQDRLKPLLASCGASARAS